MSELWAGCSLLVAGCGSSWKRANLGSAGSSWSRVKVNQNCAWPNRICALWLEWSERASSRLEPKLDANQMLDSALLFRRSLKSQPATDKAIDWVAQSERPRLPASWLPKSRAKLRNQRPDETRRDQTNRKGFERRLERDLWDQTRVRIINR